MMDPAACSKLPSVDLGLTEKLRDPDYREGFFLAETSAGIARQLIALRRRRNLSQAELAKLADTKQSAISRAEQSTYRNWSFSSLWKLTNALGGRLRVVIEAWEDVLSEYSLEPTKFIEDARYLPRSSSPTSEPLRLGASPDYVLDQSSIPPQNINRALWGNQKAPSLATNTSDYLGSKNGIIFYRSEQGHLLN